MTEKLSLRRRVEDAAAAYLERAGITVVERRWKCDFGIIDVVAWDADTLVFIDVKSRIAERSEGIKRASASTMRRIKRIADAYVQSVRLDDIRRRFDRIDLLVVASDRALLRHSRDIANND